MAKINGLEKMSYAELVNLQKRVEEAISEKRVADARRPKTQLRQMAEKAGFDIKESVRQTRITQGHRHRQIPQPERFLADLDGSWSQAQLARGCCEEGCEDRLLCDLKCGWYLMTEGLAISRAFLIQSRRVQGLPLLLRLSHAALTIRVKSRVR